MKGDGRFRKWGEIDSWLEVADALGVPCYEAENGCCDSPGIFIDGVRCDTPMEAITLIWRTLEVRK